MSDPKSFANLHAGAEMSDGAPVSYVYQWVNVEGRWSPPIEVAWQSRLCNGEVGPDVGFAHGVGFPLPMEKRWSGGAEDLLGRYLSGRYVGEVARALDAQGRECDVQFGHQPHLLSMYCELMDLDTLLRWAVRGGEAPALPGRLALSVLASRFPFPLGREGSGGTDPLPCEAAGLAHVWRQGFRTGQQVAFVTGAGEMSEPDPLAQARRRVLRTLRRMRSLEDSVVYRTDGGFKLLFALSADAYRKSGGAERGRFGAIPPEAG